ncbi:MAG: glycoside hydrolase, partial [Firmicutes bacterium]|nr:glycoside hydrolase [Bacillota bacterium]
MELLKGIQPFWFWNGDMDPDEIRRQIREMHEKGIHGFLIHPRQGMEIPYLSAEFFRRVQIAVEEAAACGMEVWLYDEYPYPSGVAAGLVTVDHPEYLCKTLATVVRDTERAGSVRIEA